MKGYTMNTTTETVQSWGFYKNYEQGGLYTRQAPYGHMEYWNPAEPEVIVIKDAQGQITDIWKI
jgi:hypothetical protein